ncbi:MAG: type II toxin-antitoxin system YafQ family toxin [Desulfovibrio sp.]|nr:type II toxin-antitoxin system YafQ family toxin [Desulfovibrio sp.]
MDFLVNRKPLPKKYHDHQLSGILRKSRGLHIEPDGLLIYTYIVRNKIRLECTGTHHHVLHEKLGIYITY